jgi:predicted 2-oxoglutarate/Fe(II)-dependent dioxygenase YbiX
MDFNYKDCIPRDLKSYFKIYNNFISKEICEQTVLELDTVAGWEQHTYEQHDGSVVPKNGERELDVNFTHVSTREILMQRIWDGYKLYQTELNFSWFKGWRGFSPVRFNRYNVNSVMSKHCDHIHTVFDGTKKGIPILSAVGILNDDYSGGEFVMWDEVIEVKAGDLLVFPSVFLYPHMVKPVLSGTRYSFVSWCY